MSLDKKKCPGAPKNHISGTDITTSPTMTSTTLPPVDTTPILLIKFTERASPQLIDAVAERLVEGGLIIVVKEDEILGISTTQLQLEAEAEHVRLVKRKQESGIMEQFSVREKKKYMNQEGFWKDAEGLFTANDRSVLVWRIVDDILVLPEGQISSNLSRILDQLHVRYRLSTKYDKEEHVMKLRYILQQYGLCTVASVHAPHIRNQIFHKTMYNLTVPLDEIRDYYGEEIAFYFAWMAFLTKWLLIPGIFGVITMVQRWWRQDTIDEDEYTPFYGLLCFLWAIVYSRFWQRHEHRLAYSWGTYAQSEYERKAYFLRPNFRGTLRKSPITGAMETYYPASRRRLKYVVSALITVVLLGVAFCVTILSLNLQGYIRPNRDPERWGEHPHPFHFPALSSLAQKGQVFDATSTWKALTPVVVHVLCIFSMNYVYRRIAERLTEWENHETVFGFQNSLILKRFLFEAFDCYVALFYLAFYERDVDRLRLELITVFNIDTFRRLLCECILPMLLQRVSTPPAHQSHKKHDDNPDTASYAPLVADANRDAYEQFDDYMEIVIQLGYVTLFASAYPLASLIAIVANLVEIRADCFKLTHVCQRPRPMRTDTCGMWNTLVSCILWLSALTNCLIFGFTSDQLMQYLPQFYYLNEQGHTRLAEGRGWIVVFIIFGVERLLVYTGLLIYAVVPEIPEDVMEELERRHFVRMQESKRIKEQRMSIASSLLTEDERRLLTEDDRQAELDKKK